MPEDSFLCVICNQREKSLSKLLKCGHCSSTVHAKCKGLSTEAVRALREGTYYCSTMCEFIPQMKTVITEVKEMRGELRSIKETMDDLESSHTYLSGQMEDLLQDIKSLKSDQATLRKHVSSLEGKHDTVSNKVDQLEQEVDRLQRTAITTHAVVLGIPNKPHEVPEQIIKKVAAAVGFVLPDEAILEASRLASKETSSSKTHPIKVVFSQEQYKEELFSKKKQHGPLSVSAVDPEFAGAAGRVTLRDELTQYGLRLLKKVRDIQHDADIKFVWPGRNGAVLAKQTENSKTEVIRNQKDVERLERTSSKRLLNSSMSNATTSPESGPNAKNRRQ